MNIYFLVEGGKTEPLVYPMFCNVFFDGRLTQVEAVHLLDQNNFFILSAGGYPQVFTTILKSTIQDINQHGNINYLFICLDSEETAIEDREQELNQYLDKYKNEDGIELIDCRVILVVQNRCIETWFLGNRRIYKDNPQSELLRKYQNHYDVSRNDPELMPKLASFDLHATFHLSYLKELLKERKARYSKRSVASVNAETYINELVQRVKNTDHLKSFSYFYNICMEIYEKMK